MFDEFRAVDGCDQERCSRAIRASLGGRASLAIWRANGVDGGEVGIAVLLLRRRSYADKDGITGANRLSSIVGVGHSSGFASGFGNVVEVALVKGHFARLELRDALGVHVSADDIVSSPSETCSGYEINVATTNYREFQSVSPKTPRNPYFD